MSQLKVTNEEYLAMVKQLMPATNSFKTVSMAFIIGGLICTLGQLIFNAYLWIGLEEELARTALSCTLVFISALLTGLDVYGKIAKYGGAGTLVPITGFSNAVSAAAIEYKTEGLILGVGAKMFTIAGPVIVYGVAASAIYGIFLMIF